LRMKVSLASGLHGTLTLRDGAAREAPSVATRGKELADAKGAAEAFRAIVGAGMKEREHVLSFSVDSRRRIIAAHEVSIGSLMSSVIHPREVFRHAIADNAAGVILAHNHPSDDATPSVEDHQVTLRLAEAGSVLGVRLIDHVVVVAEGFRSFRDEGWLPERF